MIHLHRPGELSTREQAALARHLATCSACAADQQEVLATDLLLQRVRSMEPAAEEPDTITPGVLAALERQAAAATLRAKPGIATRLADLVFAPATRYATVALASASVVLLLVQGVSTLRTVSTLERSIAVSPEGPKLAYVVSSDILMLHPMMRNLWSLALQTRAARTGNNLVIPRAAVEHFIDQDSPEAAAAMTGAMLSGISARRIGTILYHVKQASEITVIFDTRGR
jgi:hypothetical protein